MGPRTSRVFTRLVSGLALLAAVHACGDSNSSVGPDPQADARLVLSAVVTGTPIAVVTAEVTAADIVTPLLFNLTITNGVASGALKLPPGAARTVTVRAFEQSGSITHEGAVTVDIRAGQNPPVTIVLRPRAGQLPITATLGEVSVVVAPATVGVTVGTTAQLTATILDADGNPVSGTVEWASGNPALASVNSTGLVTGLVEGQTQISASFEGVAGSATVSVQPGNMSGHYNGTAANTLSAQGVLNGSPVTFGSEIVLGCPSPCPAGLDLLQTGATTAAVNLTMGQAVFSSAGFQIVAGANVTVLDGPLMQASFDVTIDGPQGPIVAPTTCTLDTRSVGGSGGLSLDTTPEGSIITAALPLSCSGAGPNFSFVAAGGVTLHVVKPAT